MIMISGFFIALYAIIIFVLNVVDINERKYDYQTGVNYMDIIGDSEKLGDYAINVVEAHTQVKLTT